MYIRIGFDPVGGSLRKDSVRFDDAVCRTAFLFTIKFHVCDIDVHFAQTIRNMSDDSGFVLLDDDESAVFSGKVDFYFVDPCDSDFSSPTDSPRTISFCPLSSVIWISTVFGWTSVSVVFVVKE